MIPIAIDTETFLITRDQPSPPNVCLSWSDGDESGVIHHTEVKEFILDLCNNDEYLIIGHNIAYDMCSLCNSFPELFPYIFALYQDNHITDIMLRQQLFDIAVGKVYSDDKVGRYSLASLWETIFDEKAPNFESKIKDNPDSWRLRYGELYDLPIKDWPDGAKEYAELDAIMTWEIYNVQQTEATDYFRDDTFQAYSYFCLNWISINGMTTSPTKTILFEREQKRKYESFIPRLQEAGLIEYNSKKDTYTKKKLPTQKRILEACQEFNKKPFLTDKGKKLEKNGELPKDHIKYLATDKPAVYWSEDELLIERLEFVAAEKMITTYIPVLKKGYELPITDRIELAATGRTTSSAPREPLKGTNKQNWPRETNARNCFIPRDGYLFLSADFSGAELHSFAQVCKRLIGFSDLGNALNEGIDVHLYVAALVEGIPYKQALKQLKKGDKKLAKNRFYSKMANFGFMGGMVGRTWEYNRLKDGIYVPTGLGDKLRKIWMSTWTEAKLYLRYQSNLLNKNFGEVTIELDWSKRLRLLRKYTSLSNTWFQSLTADGSKKAINEVIRRCYIEEDSYLYDCRPVNFVHDELILEVPDYDDFDFRNKLIEEFIQIMEDEFNEVVPDYPTTVDAVLMDCWNKNAKKIIDKNGYWRCDRDG